MTRPRFYPYHVQTGAYASGGFDSHAEAEDYARRHGCSRIILEDLRHNPAPEAIDILQRVWVHGVTLKPDEYATLVRLAGLESVPIEEHPPALFICLALAGKFSAWEDSGALKACRTVPVSLP